LDARSGRSSNCSDQRPTGRDEHERREEDADRRRHGARRAAEEVADERRRDHDRPRRHHPDGDGVEKLTVAEPVVLIDHLRLQKRHDDQSAAEDECTRFCEKPCELPKEACPSG